jgi:ABC-type polar amino acid transport system ATPase subunit
MEGSRTVTPVLEVRDVSAAFGSRTILDGIHLSVSPGELVVLMGLSGAGKSTALRIIAGLERFSSGTIRLDEVTLQQHVLTPRSRLRTKVGLVFQSHCLFEHLTALDNVRLALLHVLRTASDEATGTAMRLLEDLGVGQRASAWPRELSGGEAQRVAIARALAMDPPVLLLDEPTASLDPARRNELGRILRNLAASGRALLMTSHDDDFVAAYATRVAVLSQGRIVEEGEPQRVLREPAHEATRALLADQRR